VTDAGLATIEKVLGYPLPLEYRRFLRDHSDEIRKIKDLCPLRSTLWTEANEITRQNLEVRKAPSQMAVGAKRQPWPEHFMVVGTNGAGDYWFIDRTGAKRGLWFFEHESSAISQDHARFADYLQKLRRDARDPARWQFPKARSSFDKSCPLLERFSFFISPKNCGIECQEADRPLTAAKLRQHGIDLNEVGNCVLGVVAALAKCDRAQLKISKNPKPSQFGALQLKFTRPPIADPRFRAVGANIFKGNIYVSLYGPNDEAPAPNRVGIDWSAFRTAVALLLKSIHPPGTRVKVSKVKPSRFSMLREQWNYDFAYSLK
jgi:hypothetical protein